jgi:hypothetical protein
VREKNWNTFQTEGASEKRVFAFERGIKETLKTHEKNKICILLEKFWGDRVI